MFSRALFQPADPSFQLDFHDVTRDAKAIQVFVRQHCNQVKVLLNGGSSISDEAIGAVRKEGSFVVAIGDVRAQTTVKEISKISDAQEMIDGPFGSRHFEVVFLAIPAALRGDFVRLLNSLMEVEHTVGMMGAGDQPLRSLQAPTCTPVPFEVRQDGASLVVTHEKHPSTWTDLERSLFDVIVKDELQPLVDEDTFDQICSEGIISDAVYQAQLFNLRDTFIKQYNLQHVEDRVKFACQTGQPLALECPVLEGVEYPLEYEGIPVRPIAPPS